MPLRHDSCMCFSDIIYQLHIRSPKSKMFMTGPSNDVTIAAPIVSIDYSRSAPGEHYSHTHSSRVSNICTHITDEPCPNSTTPPSLFGVCVHPINHRLYIAHRSFGFSCSTVTLKSTPQRILHLNTRLWHGWQAACSLGSGASAHEGLPPHRGRGLAVERAKNQRRAR